MSSLRLRKVLRDLWLHRARTLLVVLAIVTGLVGAGAVLDSWALLRRVTGEGYLATNPASATLRLDVVDSALLAAVRAIPAVRDAEARRTVSASVQQADGSWIGARLFVSPNPAMRRIGVLAGVAGSWPPRDGTFVVEKSSMEVAGIALGDSISVRVGASAPVRLPVTGIVRDAGLPPGWMDHVVYGFVTSATLVALGAPEALDQLQIVVRDRSLDREAVRAVTSEVRTVATRMGRTVRAIDVPQPLRHEHAAQMDSLLMTMGAFGALALLMSAFLVVNLVTAMLAGQLREIGVMKAIGAQPAQLAAMYLGLALALGMVASLIAIPLAALLGTAYARFSADLLNFDIAGYGIPARAILVQLAAGLLLPVLAAAVPVIRGCRIPVSVALRDVGIDAGDALPQWLDRVRGPSRPVLLSLRNAFRRRRRMALTLLTLAVGGAALLGALDLRASIRRATGNLYGELFRFDMTIRLDTSHDADSLQALVAHMDGVAIAETWADRRAVLATADGLGATISVTALPARSELVSLPVLAGRWLRDEDATAVVVTAHLLDEHPELTLGRDATLAIDGANVRWRVVGVVEAGPAAMAFVTRPALAQAVGNARVTTVVLRARARDGDEQSALLLRLRSALEDAGDRVGSSQLIEASRRVIEDHLLMVAAFLLAMAQLAIVVGGLGLASTISLGVLERTREIGVLRAIGASPRAIMALVQTEGLVIALLSWLLAIPLSLPVSLLLGRAFGQIMIPVPLTLRPEWMALGLWLAIVVLVSIAACTWPAARAGRISVVGALAYE